MPPETPARARSLRATYDGLLALITGRRVDADSDHANADADASAGADVFVVGDDRASAAARVHVYQHMYRSRMVEALESQFPRLARWLGADTFAELVAAYVADCPSRHPSLRWLGASFPDWLAARPTSEARHPALADLARLEWARADVFDAADEATLMMSALHALPPDSFAELPLRLVGAHRRLSLAHPVAALWDAIGPAGAAPGRDVGIAAAAADAGISTSAQSLLVWRQGVAVFHRAIDAAERAALDAIAAGTTFGLVCEALAAGDRAQEEAAAQAFTWLSTWCTDEVLAAPP